MKKLVFQGSGVALVTPMKQDGTVNYEKLDELIEWHIQSGTDAIVACATSGESPVLNHEEHCKAVQFVVKKVKKRVPVVASSGSNDTAYALELSRSAKELGADALLMVTPYYNKTSQTGLVRHYNYVADRVDLPIILYNVPSRTGCNIKPETYRELSKHPNIVATKEANGDISAVAKTISLCGDDLTVYSGEDSQTYPILALGGKGVISVLANLLPNVMHQICADYFSGNIEASRTAFLKHFELMDALFMDVNPIPVKAALKMMGNDCGDCRLPLTTMSEQDHRALADVLRKYGLIQ